MESRVSSTVTKPAINDDDQLKLGGNTKKNRTEERFTFDGRIEFHAIKDHILESVCHHSEGSVCQVCLFEKELGLPHLPEMIFPHNVLALRLAASDQLLIGFNTFDALKMVDTEKLPGIQVGPSAVWQEARKEQMPLREFQQPFDWTFTSEYQGTLGPGVRVTEATGPRERIDYERLKQREPIIFYSQLTLYEDELADHGCAQLTVRVRVMPSCYFVLCRFYLRVDHVMVRVCDTRLYGETRQPFAICEWSRREALYNQLEKKDLENVLDANLISNALPVVETKTTKLEFPTF